MAYNPTASVGLSVVNGSAATFMRSDGAPALDQSIAPTMTGAWAFNNAASTTVAKGLYANTIAAQYFMATSSSATSTFAGNVRIDGNLRVLGTVAAEARVTASSDVIFNGNVTFTNITSALMLTGAGGLVAEYTGAAACTNQFVTALSALGVTTCASINNDQWSGTDLSIANGGTGSSSATISQLLYGGSSAYQSVATTSQALSAAFSSSGSFGALVGGTSGTLSFVDQPSFTGFATTTTLMGTSSTKIMTKTPLATTFNTASCEARNGNGLPSFYVVSIGYGTASSTYFIASSTKGTVTLNFAVPANSDVFFDFGTTTSTTVGAGWLVNCTFKRTT